MSDLAAGATPRRPVGWWVAFVAAAAAYAALRFALGEEYQHASWAALMDATAPRPFGHRVLVPQIARWIVGWSGQSAAVVFTCLEGLAAWAVLETMTAALSRRRSADAARLLALAGLVVVGITYMAPRTWPIFYPWDTPAVAVIAGAVAAADRGRYGWIVVLAVVGGLNRESAGLVPLVLVALRYEREPDRRALWGWAALAAGAYGLARVAIALVWSHNPGPPLHFTISGQYRLLHNLQWLAAPSHWLRVLVWGGWMLVAWPFRASVIGWPWRRLGGVAWLWIGAGLVVANVYEPRATGEAVAVGWLALAAGPEPAPPSRTRVVAAIDTLWIWGWWAALAVLAVTLHRWAWLPPAQWPMPK